MWDLLNSLTLHQHNRLAPALPPASAPSDEDPRSLASHMVFRTSADAFLAAPPMDRLFPSPSEIVATTALNEDLPLIGPSSDAADLLRAPDVSQPSPVLGREISQIEIEMGDESGRSFRDALSMVRFSLCCCARCFADYHSRRSQRSWSATLHSFRVFLAQTFMTCEVAIK